ncbi:MAG: hypothetical protein ACK5PP_18730 [Acidimicrobiales bacterium]
MAPAELMDLDVAAEALGIRRDVLLQRLRGGAVPEAVGDGENWRVPSGALSTIAAREGWCVRDAELSRSTHGRGTGTTAVLNGPGPRDGAMLVLPGERVPGPERAVDDRVAQLESELAACREELDRIERDLVAGDRRQVILERDRAHAEANAEQLQRQLERDRTERDALSDRLAETTVDRDDAVASLGWWSRRRYQRRRDQADPSGT